jgi:hypothetical protein
MTKEMRKKARATMPRDSRHVRPMAMMDEANCHVAALRGVRGVCGREGFVGCSTDLKASETQ